MSLKLKNLEEPQLRITEVFFSIQGETTRMGLPTTFVRLTGCPLRCRDCDSAYAFQGGQLKTFSELLAQVKSFPTKWITVTGGEPLAQREAITFLTLLADEGFDVSLETSGALNIAEVDVRTKIIMDLKPPSSNEVSKNRWENLKHLKPSDEIKIVIAERADFDWAVEQVQQHRLNELVSEVLFSPSFGVLSLRDLAEWILESRLPVRMQTQLHKHIWGNEPGK